LDAGWAIRVPFLADTGDLSVLRNIQTGSGIHPASCSVGTGGFSTGVKRLMSAVKWSTPSSTKVKNGVLPLLPLYAFMAWTGTTVVFNVRLSLRSIYS